MKKGTPLKEVEKILSGRQVADHFGVDVHSVRRWRYMGCPAIIYNPKLIRYRLSEVEEWLRNRKVKLSSVMSKAGEPALAK